MIHPFANGDMAIDDNPFNRAGSLCIETLLRRFQAAGRVSHWPLEGNRNRSGERGGGVVVLTPFITKAAANLALNVDSFLQFCVTCKRPVEVFLKRGLVDCRCVNADRFGQRFKE